MAHGSGIQRSKSAVPRNHENHDQSQTKALARHSSTPSRRSISRSHKSNSSGRSQSKPKRKTVTALTGLAALPTVQLRENTEIHVEHDVHDDVSAISAGTLDFLAAKEDRLTMNQHANKKIRQPSWTTKMTTTRTMIVAAKVTTMIMTIMTTVVACWNTSLTNHR